MDVLPALVPHVTDKPLPLIGEEATPTARRCLVEILGESVVLKVVSDATIRSVLLTFIPMLF